MKNIRVMLLACSAACFVSGQAAWAQTAPAAVEQPEREPDGKPAPTDEIVVTAQKRSESVQRIPGAVTVADGDQIDSLGIRNIAQLAAVAPSVRFTTRAQQTLIYMRGIGQAVTQPNAEPAVAVNINGVYIPSEMTNGGMFDVERVEVVNGPQGTLYGRNAVGGVLNVVTKLPTSERTMESALELGNYDYLQAFAAMNLPIGDTLAIRVAGLVSRRNGFYSDGADDLDRTAIRVTGRWTPSAQTTVTLAGTYSHNGGIGSKTQNNPPLNGDWRRTAADARLLGYFTDFDTYLLSGQVEHSLSNQLTLTYVGGYNHVRGRDFNDVFPGPPTVTTDIPQETELVTHEARLNGDFDGLTFVAGLYYYDTSIYFESTSIRPGPAVRNNRFEQEGKGYAGFGQATLTVLPGVRVTGGIRYSHDEKDIDGYTRNFVRSVQTNNFVFGGVLKSNRTDWRAGAELDVSPTSLLYGSVATGFNQGGFSTAPDNIGSTSAPSFLPVTLTAYTVGMKNRLFDNFLTLNFEAFLYDYKNYQVASRNLATGENQIYNAPSSRVKGVQIDASLSPIRGGRLNGSVTILDGKILRLTTPAGNFDGRLLPYAPRVALNISYQQEVDLTDGNQLRFLGNYSYTAAQFGVYTNANGSLLEPKHKLDLNLDLVGDDGAWSVGVWGRNVTNSQTFELLNTGAIPGPGAGRLEPPRTYGVRLVANF